MAVNDDVRERIISSVFARIDEDYVAHLKVWEDSGADAEGLKPRYIILSQSRSRSGYIHKSKLNSNGTFSVGKTWSLQELRGLEVLSAQIFNITLARTYRWQTEDSDNQTSFLIALVSLFRSLVGNPTTLRLINVPEPNATGSRSRSSPIQTTRAPAVTSPDGQRSSNGNYDTPSQPRTVQTPARVRVDQRRAPSPGVVQSRTAPPGPGTKEYAQQTSYTSATSAGYASSTRQSAGTTESSLRYSTEGPQSTSTSRSTPVATSSLSSTYGSRPVPKSSTQRSSSPQPTPSTSKNNDTSSRSNLASRQESLSQRRDQNARISFFDPANQVTLDRMLASDAGDGADELGEETSQATLANVEEMLEGYEWASDTALSGNTTGGAVDQIEAKLSAELMALDKANMYSFIESDDRIGLVLKFLDEAILELDGMDSQLSSYKIHLNAVNDDISFIQSQNRGLQVQTQNQRALLSELEDLLQTVQVRKELLVMLTQESLESVSSIERLEKAAAELYKALQAGRDRDMAATMERLEEYRTYNAQFCKRVYDYLSIVFTAQSKLLLGDSEGLGKKGKGGRPVIIAHQEFEAYLGRYCGLILYLKEMDEISYGKLCAAYFSAASELHCTQMKALLSIYTSTIKSGEEEGDQSFAITPIGSISKSSNPLRRAGTLVRSPLGGRREGERTVDGDVSASEALTRILEEVSPQVCREQDFIADFLQINDAALTFADYMGLENYFRRQAARSVGLSQQTVKLVRGAMDLMFGFLPAELKTWADTALSKDSLQVIGITACLERFLSDAQERGSPFLSQVLDKLHSRFKALYDRHVVEQIRSIEKIKLTSKKRNGVAPFIKYFPVYVGRVENQLIGCDTLEIRQSVDSAYDKIVQTMFESLKQMAKLDGEGEDKGQINYHVILIENMHYFATEIRQQEIGSVGAFSRRAQDLYEENLSAYVMLIMRRPFAKIIDYFEGVERLLKTTAPTEVANNSSYSRSALKKVVKEYDSKDIRKHIDTLFKRVEKHFTEATDKPIEENSGLIPGTVLVGVWKACEEELLRITELFNRQISQCYPNMGVSLEYTATDVEAAFRRHITST